MILSIDEPMRVKKEKLESSSKRNRSKKGRSISRDLTIFLVLVVVVTFALVISVRSLVVSRKAKAQLEEKVDEYMSYLIDSLELPIWNLDEESVRKIGKSYIDNELVAVIRITRPDGNVIFEKVKENEQDLIKRAGKVIHDGEIIGHIELGLTKRLYKENNRQLLWTSVLMMLVIISALSGVTGLLLRVFLKRPIDDLLKGIDRIAKGDYEYKFHEAKQREIETIITSFNYMAKQINSREKSLNSVNRRLEDEISEHKRAVEALRESEEKYRGIFENAVEGIFQSTQDGRFISVNPALARIIGYDSPAEMIENVTDIAQQLYVDPAQQDELIRLCKQGLVFNFEEQLYRKDGSKIWVSINARPTFDETGNLICIEGIILDITEQKKSEEKIKNYSKRLEEMVEERTKALKDAQEQLVRQEKLAVIGQLASGVGHELRNPIGVIGNSTYYLNMKLKDVDDKTKKHLDILQREVLRTNTIITDLLDFSRVKPPAFEEADLNNIVKETISTTEVPENITLETKLDEKLPRISVDADQIRRVIMNIASNAVGAMPDGGRLKINSGVKKDFVEITFKDTGEGISKENLQKIFEPLFTMKAKGIGLGLAIVKGIVEGHKGEIEVESEVGKGSTFIIKLPAQSKRE